jgi:Leucine-rich repeat (LRR) protein
MSFFLYSTHVETLFSELDPIQSFLLSVLFFLCFMLEGMNLQWNTGIRKKMGNKQPSGKVSLLNEALRIPNPEDLSTFNNFDIKNRDERIQKIWNELLTRKDSSVEVSLSLDRALLNDSLSLSIISEKKHENIEVRLRSVDLSYNRLTREPFGLKDDGKFQLFNAPQFHVVLDQLKILDMSHNKLNTLSETMFQYTPNLIELNLSWNNIKKLPESLFDLNHLTSLNIERNEIIQLSPSINKLSQLRRLNLNYNLLNNVPELDGLNSLEIFTMNRYPGSNGKDVSFPSIKQMPNLRKIHWRYQGASDITNFLSDKSSANSIEEIDLSYNEIHFLPDCHRFLNVINLRLCACKLSSLPESFSTLHNLKKLYLRMNNFTSIPDMLFELTGIEELDFCMNNLISIDSRISKLINLKKLGLASNNIKELPSEILILKNLIKLRVDENPINGLNVNIDSLKFDPNGQHSLSNNQEKTNETILSRIKGCLFGQCIGDAMGLATEFMQKKKLSQFMALNLSIQRYYTWIHIEVNGYLEIILMTLIKCFLFLIVSLIKMDQTTKISPIDYIDGYSKVMKF